MKGKVGPPVTVRTPENIEAISEIMKNQPGSSTRRVSQQVGMSRETARIIMRKDLEMYPYKIQL